MPAETSRCDVVIVEDDPEMRALLERWLQREGHDTRAFADAESMLAALPELVPEVICLDLELPGIKGLEALARLREEVPSLPVVVVTAHREVDIVVEAMRGGAFDFLVKPVDRFKLGTTLARALEHRRQHLRIAELERQAAPGDYPSLVGRCEPMRELCRQIDRLAGRSISVLIHGESGTGKELVARALHEHSPRAGGAFVAVNCAAIPENLQESELFGHERGAFTGAHQQRKGHFELAHGGTLFLDEVAEMSMGLQAKLLRVLQERTLTRLGGNRSIEVDFRLVAASHKDLRAEVDAGRFREDLYYRIAVFDLEIPPLRARGDDVVLLARHFLDRLAEGTIALSDEAARALAGHAWPGNVRELENAIHRAIVVCRGHVVRPEDLPAQVRDARPQEAPAAAQTGGAMSLEEIEKRALVEALERANGNVAEVVRQLGIGRTTVYRKLKKYGLR